MKIHFGFANPDQINKLAPALQALDLNLLKAEPSKVPLKGLYRIAQDGYADYSSHLPAFMYATELGKSVPLSREGYPVMIQASNMLPLRLPQIYIAFRGQKDVTPAIKSLTEVKPISVRDKNLKAYTLEYKPGLLGALNASEFERQSFPIANTVSADDLSTLITIVRVLSSFLRAHKYPAFQTNEAFEFEYSSHIEHGKHQLKPDEYETDELGNPTKRMATTSVDGEPTWGKPELDSAGVVVHLKRAKPSDLTIPAWGDAASIPVTDGVVFPFVEELAIWDKDTVCNLFGSHFVRSLGHTTDGCLKMYSELCTHWKRSLYRTSLGNVLSHMCRVIELAIPAQARAYPIIDRNRYLGCYLSGAGYSIAHRSELLRPMTFSANQEDFDCFDSTDALLMKILAVVTTAHKEKKNIEKIRAMASTSMRGLDDYLTTWIIQIDKWEKIRSLAARIRYPQEYLRINMENIQQVITWLKSGTVPDKETPMHAYGLGRKSMLELTLSSFGPSAPSPNIPGSQKIPVSAKIPSGFNKLLAFRTTSLETAIADWKELGEKGFVYNGPDRLSGKYQYVQVRGESEREKWFSALADFHVWFREEQRKNISSDVVGVDLELLEGVLLGQEDGLDLSGF